MPNRMPMVSATEKWCNVGPPKKNIDSTMICVEPWVMMVRLVVLVMAWSITSGVLILRILRKVSRIRSKITTDSLTE